MKCDPEAPWFDLVFMGPPYKDADKNALSLVEPTLNAVINNELCKPTGLIVAQHHKKEEFKAPVGWEMVRREPYGDTFLSFVRKENTHS
jgi:16S rRNA G966 N2-methylase RsmD